MPTIIINKKYNQMKKKLLTFLLLSFCTTLSFANGEQEKVNLTLQIINQTGSVPYIPHAPVRIPILYQDGHTLTFESSHTEYILTLVKDNEQEYSTIISSTTTQIVLPEHLEGEYEIQLVSNRIVFIGNITL